MIPRPEYYSFHFLGIHYLKHFPLYLKQYHVLKFKNDHTIVRKNNLENVNNILDMMQLNRIAVNNCYM